MYISQGLKHREERHFYQEASQIPQINDLLEYFSNMEVMGGLQSKVVEKCQYDLLPTEQRSCH